MKRYLTLAITAALMLCRVFLRLGRGREGQLNLRAGQHRRGNHRAGGNRRTSGKGHG